MKIKDADLEQWPKSWEGITEDIPYGKKLIEIFMLFIEDMKSKKLSAKTINEHIDNLWMLGGYIIEQLNYYEEKQEIEPLEMVKACIDSGDGPLIYDFSEYQQERFDATCRKLYRYLSSSKGC
jgi:hypothetical protein